MSAPDDTRRCSRCHKFKPLDQFARDASKSSGRKSHCRACDNAKSRRYYADNRDIRLAAVKDYQRRRRLEVR